MTSRHRDRPRRAALSLLVLPPLAALAPSARVIGPHSPPASRALLAPADSPGPRRGHALVYDAARKVVLLFGGMKSTGEPAELADARLFSWDGKTWRVAAPEGGPSPRQHACAAYDAKRRRLVLYGGTSGDGPEGTLDDTWEWDGAKWTQSKEGGAGARLHATAAYDAQRGKVLLFGGFDAAHGKERLDLLEWDGERWSPVAGAPPPLGFAPKLLGRDATHAPLLFVVDPKETAVRTFTLAAEGWRESGGGGPHALDAAMCDAGRRGVLLFGGYDGKAYSAATFRRSETPEPKWERVETSGPAARGASAIAFDAVRGRCVLYGGASNRECFADTWEFDGARWTRAAPK